MTEIILKSVHVPKPVAVNGTNCREGLCGARGHYYAGAGQVVEEIREVTNMAYRIAAILLLEPELNANYEAVKANTYDWPK
jgi:hypothetical protein